jgi:hypothetical protein
VIGLHRAQQRRQHWRGREVDPPRLSRLGFAVRKQDFVLRQRDMLAQRSDASSPNRQPVNKATSTKGEIGS